MINALASVPLAVLGPGGGLGSGDGLPLVRARCPGDGLPGLRGHLQDTILTGLAWAFMRLYRADRLSAGSAAQSFARSGSGRWPGRARSMLLSAVQWIPSKELLDRSPRAGG